MLRRSGVHFFAFKGCVEGIIGGRWLGRWVGDSNSVDLSALHSEFVEKWCVFVVGEVMCR